MTEQHGSPDETARQWREAAGREDLVLLDGFHALKHALRFGADVRMVVADDPDGVRALAAELAPDVAADVARLVSAGELRTLVNRVHPTGVAALAVRPDRAEGRARLDRRPRTAPVVVLDNPRNLGNVGAVVRLAAGFGATGVVTRGDLDPWHPNVVRAGAGLHYATTVDRVDLDTLPAG
ncbi:TrmH family RNA methyltransferase, partial [Streptomyces sp. NPDC001193]